MTDEMKLIDITKSLTTKQAWSIGTAIIALLAGAITFGGYIQNIKSTTEMNRSASELNSVKNDLSTLKSMKEIEITRLQADVAKEKAQIESTKAELASTTASLQKNKDLYEIRLKELKLKAEFLNRYVGYLASDQTKPEPENTSMKLFVDFVHNLWKQQQQNQINFTTENIQSGASVERVYPSVSPFPVSIEKPMQPNSEEVIKIIKFTDGTSYQLPLKIAVAVHHRPS